MSTFVVPVKRIRAIEPHPNADAIEFAVVDGYRSIVRKGQFEAGDLIVYLPEQALIPEWMLQKLGLWDEEKGKGKLAGSNGDRVKAIKLRGEISQGLIWPLEFPITGMAEGDDVASLFGITKWEPPIPVALAGDVWNAGTEFTLAFDIENIKSNPDAIHKNTPVTLTEKIHGTFTGITILPFSKVPLLKEPGFGKYGNILIWSKGLGAKGLVFKNTVNNTYVRATAKLIEELDAAHDSGAKIYDDWDHGIPYSVLGETFGPGIQDLTYGDKVDFRAFGVVNYSNNTRDYLPRFSLIEWLREINSSVSPVPVLYHGPFDPTILAEHTSGKSTLANHIREGVVIELYNGTRFKSVSPDYLTRKNGTEYN